MNFFKRLKKMQAIVDGDISKNHNSSVISFLNTSLIHFYNTYKYLNQELFKGLSCIALGLLGLGC